MTVSLKTNGVEVSSSGVASSVTLTPAYPVGSVAKDLNILTVACQPVTGTVPTPPGWVRVIQGTATDNESGDSWLVTIFSRRGAFTGTQSVTATRTLGEGEITASIDVYERAAGKTWSVLGHADEYTYTDDEDIVHTGTNVFVTINELSPTIVVTFNDSVFSPGFDILVHGIDDYNAITVTAIDTTAHFGDLVVRGAKQVDVSGDDFAVSDYEFPNFDNVKYRADFYIDGVLQDSLFSDEQIDVPREFFVSEGLYPSMTSWLRSVHVPELSIPVFVTDLSKRKREGRVLSKSTVLGKKFPVVSVDVAGSREGTLSIICGIYPNIENGQPEDVDLLIDRGDTLLLSHIDAISLHEAPTYLVVETVDRSRLGVYDHALFQYDIDYTEIERPAVDVAVGIGTWQTVYDNNLTWQSVYDTHDAWIDVLLEP